MKDEVKTMNREGGIGKVEENTTKHGQTLFPVPYAIFMALFFLLALPSCQSAKEPAKPPVRLGSDVKDIAREVLAQLAVPVTIQITRGGEGETAGEESQALVELAAEVSPHVVIQTLDISSRTDAESLGVSHGPVIEMKGKAPGILRYYGYPERKETRPFFQGILSAAGREAKLTPVVRSYLSGLDREILIRIFTTPD